MNLKNKVILGVILSTLLFSAAYAATVAYREISTNMKIEAQSDLEIIDTDYTTILTFIDFGTLCRGDTATYPSGAPGEIYYIKNIGECDIWLNYDVTSLPSNVNLEMHIKKDPAGSWEILPASTLTTWSIAPNGYANWYIILTIGNTAPFGTFTPMITWNAHDTSIG